MGSVDVAIVGGGISGLAAAWYLRGARPDLSLRVLEASAQAGGKVGATELLGVPIDNGPDNFLARVEGGVDLAAELGLGDEMVAPGTGQAWVWSRGQLRALPAGLVLGAPTDPDALRASGILSEEGLAAALLDETTDVHLRAYDHERPDLSVAEGIGAHLGREVVERLVDPLLGGITAADCDTLSLRSASPELFAAARAPRLMQHLREHAAAAQRGQIGVSEQRPIFLTPRAGMHQLIARLVDRLGDAVRTGSPVTSLRTTADGWTLDTPQGPLAARRVVLATPAPATAVLTAPVAPALSAELAAIRTSSVVLVLFAYPTDAVTLPPGSGFLVPRPEGCFLTATSWWSQKWPHLAIPGHVIIRASAGRDGDERFLTMTDAEIVDRMHAELVDILGVRSTATATAVCRYEQGFPLYEVGHSARVERCDALAAAAGLELTGAAYRGVGMPACIRDAKRAAQRVALSL